ncbi:hypothetical protein OIU78_009353 [Salix suchowensis]|nr:hypothetical protein OIU78_009353 [Salix suchowensis]
MQAGLPSERDMVRIEYQRSIHDQDIRMDHLGPNVCVVGAMRASLTVNLDAKMWMNVKNQSITAEGYFNV